MKKISGSAFMAVLTLLATLTLSLDASAARMGSGKSFGSRPSYSAPYQRSPSAAPGNTAQQPGYRQPQTAPSPNAGLRDSMARRSGLMGMLGGLALGGLLGSMFMGGAFEHFNFMDILVFGLVAYLLYRLFAARSRRSSDAYANTGAHAASGHYAPEQVMQRDATGPGFDTDIMAGRQGTAGQAHAAGVPVMPADFDAKSFVQGAEAAYRHLQKAWDAGDLAALRSLTTDKVFAELQDQIRSRTQPNQTEIHHVDVRIIAVQDVGQNREASVQFRVMMRESQDETPKQIEEVWHFTRSLASRQPTWFLDGIQQVEA